MLEQVLTATAKISEFIDVSPVAFALLVWMVAIFSVFTFVALKKITDSIVASRTKKIEAERKAKNGR